MTTPDFEFHKFQLVYDILVRCKPLGSLCQIAGEDVSSQLAGNGGGLLGQLASDDMMEKEGGDSSMSIDKIQAEALKLHPSERARLAEALLLSLEELSDEENERLWAEEARRRHEDLVAGRASERTAADVFRDIRERL
jgi:hypothetical protein